MVICHQPPGDADQFVYLPARDSVTANTVAKFIAFARSHGYPVPALFNSRLQQRAMINNLAPNPEVASPERLYSFGRRGNIMELLISLAFGAAVACVAFLIGST